VHEIVKGQGYTTPKIDLQTWRRRHFWSRWNWSESTTLRFWLVQNYLYYLADTWVLVTLLQLLDSTIIRFNNYSLAAADTSLRLRQILCCHDIPLHIAASAVLRVGEREKGSQWPIVIANKWNLTCSASLFFDDAVATWYIKAAHYVVRDMYISNSVTGGVKII